MGPTETLARFVAETTYESLPREVVDAAKVAILDGVANLLAGSTQPVGAIVGRYVRELGGVPGCSVVGQGYKTNAPAAAFANGVFLHCLDFEIQGYPPAHGTSAILPPALAVGESLGAPGAAIIAAYAVGWDVQQRIRTAAPRGHHRVFHPPGIFGPLGGAASSASMLELDVAQVRTAFGIAASRTGGLFANNGTMVKSTHPANAGRMGLEAGLLARAGFTANDNILETREGYVDTLFEGAFDWDTLTRDLGRTFHLVDPGFNIKRYPAEIYLQWVIEAAATVRQSHDLRLEDIEVLELETPPVKVDLSRPRPRSGLDGKFSFEYCAAVALAEGEVGIDSFSDETRFSPPVEQALDKIRLTPNPDIPTDVAGIWVGARAKLKDGRVVYERCQSYRGSLANPMTRDERLTKFRECARRVLGPSDIDRVLGMIEALEELSDIRELTEVLSQQPAMAR